MRRTYKAEIWRSGESEKRLDYSPNKRQLIKRHKALLKSGDIVHIIDCYSDECIAVLVGA